MQDDALRAKVRDYLDPHLLLCDLEADTAVVLNAINHGWDEVWVPASHTRNGVAPLKIDREVILNS